MGYSLSDFFSQMAPPRRRMKRMQVADARTALAEEETDRLIDMDRVYDDAIRDVEEAGIVFMDEVDKICGPAPDHGPDVSGEGVQRDLLPILEGSVVHTRYGSVRTDHILFIAAGAFNVARPSDLIPEFQGRFPIRVELSPLSESDLQRILTEPNNALTKQYEALLGTEQVELAFTDDGVAELARQAHRVNEQDENIGARRLFTIMEKVLEEVSFHAEDHAGSRVVVDAAMVRRAAEGSDQRRRHAPLHPLTGADASDRLRPAGRMTAWPVTDGRGRSVRVTVRARGGSGRRGDGRLTARRAGGRWPVTPVAVPRHPGAR